MTTWEVQPLTAAGATEKGGKLSVGNVGRVGWLKTLDSADNKEKVGKGWVRRGRETGFWLGL